MQTRQEIPNFAKMSPDELPDQFVLTLRKPIEFGKEPNVDRTFQLELREPTLDEIDVFIKNVKKHGEIGALKFFIAQVADTEFTIVSKMGARDMTVAQEYLMAFFKGSQTTGDTSHE
jgi:hypothetical protein